MVPELQAARPEAGQALAEGQSSCSAKQSGAELLANIRDNGLIDLEIDGQTIALTREEVEVRLKPKPGWAAAKERGVVVVLSTELTPELVAEGLARDVVRLDPGSSQGNRLRVHGPDRSRTRDRLRRNWLRRSRSFVTSSRRKRWRSKIVTEPLSGVEPVRVKVLGHELAVYVRVVK